MCGPRQEFCRRLAALSSAYAVSDQGPSPLCSDLLEVVPELSRCDRVRPTVDVHLQDGGHDSGSKTLQRLQSTFDLRVGRCHAAYLPEDGILGRGRR